jgi:hypothetical protein
MMLRVLMLCGLGVTTLKNNIVVCQARHRDKQMLNEGAGEGSYHVFRSNLLKSDVMYCCPFL